MPNTRVVRKEVRRNPLGPLYTSWGFYEILVNLPPAA